MSEDSTDKSGMKPSSESPSRDERSPSPGADQNLSGEAESSSQDDSVQGSERKELPLRPMRVIALSDPTTSISSHPSPSAGLSPGAAPGPSQSAGQQAPATKSASSPLPPVVVPKISSMPPPMASQRDRGSSMSASSLASKKSPSEKLGANAGVVSSAAPLPTSSTSPPKQAGSSSSANPPAPPSSLNPPGPSSSPIPPHTLVEDFEPMTPSPPVTESAPAPSSPGASASGDSTPSEGLSSPSIEVAEEYEVVSPLPPSTDLPLVEELSGQVAPVVRELVESLNDTPVPPKRSWAPEPPAGEAVMPKIPKRDEAEHEVLDLSPAAPMAALSEPGEESDIIEVSTDDLVEAAQKVELEVHKSERKPPPPKRSAKPNLPALKRPRQKAWWETLFGDDFSRAYRAMSPSQLSREVDFILSSLDVTPGAVILDLGCGQGEICVELARRGYSVVGYDLSVYQLAMAGDNAQTAGQKINFLQGDMREMAFEQMFDAVICWDTTFGYFEEEKNLDVLARIKKALKPQGRLMIDVMNRDFVAREAPYTHWFEGDGCVCMDDMSMDWITNRMSVKRSIILDDGRSKELQFSTRLYNLAEVGRMLHDAGFRVAAVSGDVATQGAFFGPNSRRIIIQAGKP